MTKLSHNDWITFGLKVLREEGYAHLKAGTLAKRLGVTRGSFYWYFDNITSFHDALLDHWFASSVGTATQLETLTSPLEKMQALITAALHADFELEQAFRAWARERNTIAKRLDALDHMRLDVLRKIILVDHDDPITALARAKFSYAAAIGLTQIGRTHLDLTEDDIAHIARMMVSPEEKGHPPAEP